MKDRYFILQHVQRYEHIQMKYSLRCLQCSGIKIKYFNLKKFHAFVPTVADSYCLYLLLPLNLYGEVLFLFPSAKGRASFLF